MLVTYTDRDERVDAYHCIERKQHKAKSCGQSDLRVIVFLVDHVYLGPSCEVHVIICPLQA